MSTQFFERQEAQRKYTRWLVGGFIAAILLVVAGHQPGGHRRPGRQSGARCCARNPRVVVWISLHRARHHPDRVLAPQLAAARRRSPWWRARWAACRSTANDGDLKRKRLLNIVEEMAIAARIRKPQVFVLPDEPGINAFAAGQFARRSRGGGDAGRARRVRPRPAAGRDRPRVQPHPQRRHEDQHAPDGVDLRPVRDHRSRARAS